MCASLYWFSRFFTSPKYPALLFLWFKLFTCCLLFSLFLPFFSCLVIFKPEIRTRGLCLLGRMSVETQHPNWDSPDQIRTIGRYAINCWELFHALHEQFDVLLLSYRQLCSILAMFLTVSYRHHSGMVFSQPAGLQMQLLSLLLTLLASTSFSRVSFRILLIIQVHARTSASSS